MNNQQSHTQNCFNSSPNTAIFDRRNQFIDNMRKGDRADIINSRRNFTVDNNNDMQSNIASTINKNDCDQNSNMSWPVIFSYESNSSLSNDDRHSDLTLQEPDSSNARKRKYTILDIESE